MSPFGFTRVAQHPYKARSDLHKHFDATPFRHEPFAAACIPFRWMLREHALGAKKGDEGIVQQLRLGYQDDAEPELDFDADWIQARDNQLVMLDTFFGAVQPETSLCFIYAKKTPLSDEAGRILIGVGRVLKVGEPVEYKYTTGSPPLRGMLWERNVVHSIRTGGSDGFLFPYHEILELCEKDGSLRPGDYVAYAPEGHWDDYSYATEHLGHDGAIASLLACTNALRKISTIVSGSWDTQIKWIDAELNRLWRMRGAYPGFGSALRAFGLAQGNLIAYAIAAMDGNDALKADPWSTLDRAMKEPSILGPELAKDIGASFRRMWTGLAPERLALLKLLSRFAISEDQAIRYYEHSERKAAGIELSDKEILENPYLLYEADRGQSDPIAVTIVDRGVFPDPAVQVAHPLLSPSALEDAIDPRRVRALVIDSLESAADLGHTLQLGSAIIQDVRSRDLSPVCPLGVDAFSASEPSLAPEVLKVATAIDQPAYQLKRLSETRAIITEQVLRRSKGKRHEGGPSWEKLLSEEFGSLPSQGEERDTELRARKEKLAALGELYASRFSVLIGAAGTGKTTLLSVLCRFGPVDQGGVLLLAPTGKARMRLEAKTKRSGAMTLAQFLLGTDRYDTNSGRYLVTGSANRESGYKTVVIDEASMLTEEQLAATLDALKGVERLILVGDPRQLPPIGAGRPFVDIVARQAPENVESLFPRCGPGYAELIEARRQTGHDRDDVWLALNFGSGSADPAADEIWNRLTTPTKTLRLESWQTPAELEKRITQILVEELSLKGPDDQQGFEESLGGSEFKGSVYFWERRDGSNPRPGAAEQVEAWQILSPVRGQGHGVEAVNRTIQARFRARAIASATPEKDYYRRTPRPMGPQRIVYGDKVISLVNGVRRDVYPKTDEDAYVANGDIGVVVGQFKFKTMKGLPWKLEAEFASRIGTKVGYYPSEFGEERLPPLELAYALTVHKTQGSDFGITFVILPNPCWLLSKELLYTALTRQRDKLVILHQGDFRDFRKYSNNDHSDVAQRLTNLFWDPKPVEVRVGSQSRFLEKHLIHRTERGELVRSKSEVIIADKLHTAGIDYIYEKAIRLQDGTERFPDFTIIDDASGRTFMWEHLGRLDSATYRARWERKLSAYRASGIVPHTEGDGKNGTLLITRDDDRGGLDAGAIAALIRDVVK